MKQPLAFVHPDKLYYICWLKKAIYSLTQAPLAWFHYFNNFLLSHGFIWSTADTSVFIYRTCSHTLILLLYVYNIITTGTALVLHSFNSLLSQ